MELEYSAIGMAPPTRENGVSIKESPYDTAYLYSVYLLHGVYTVYESFFQKWISTLPEVQTGTAKCCICICINEQEIDEHMLYVYELPSDMVTWFRFSTNFLRRIQTNIIKKWSGEGEAHHRTTASGIS